VTRFVPLLALLAATSLLPAQDTTAVGSVAGSVRTNDTPVAGVKVCVAGLDRCVTTDAKGEYRLVDLRSGTYRLTLTAPNRPATESDPVEVRAGLEARVEFALPAIDAVSQSITVSESVFIAPEEIKNSGYLIQSREVWKSAGALQDVARYVQTLPGVAIGSNDLRNDIIVRGGSPLENLFIIDNIEIPNINAFANFASAGGTVSLLDANLIQDVTFLTGGYPAPFINRTSSVMQIAQREGDRQKFGGQATVGFAGAGGVFEGPIRKDKGSFVTSFRRSFLDLVTDDIGFGGVPVLYTWNTKATYDLTARDRIWVANISGWDNIRLGRRRDGENDEEVNNLDINYSGSRSATGFNWQRLFGDRGVGLFGVTHSDARVKSQVRDLARGGPIPPGVDFDQLLNGSPTVFADDSSERETTLKFDYTGYIPAFEKLQAGGSFKSFGINYRTEAPFGSNNPFSPVADVNPFFVRQNYRASQTGLYLQSTRSLGSRVSLTAGGRFDRYSILDAVRFSPRMGLSVRLTDRLSWRASYGQYFQQPFFLFISAFPENRGLTPFRADHYVTGFTYVASPTLRFTLEGYAKEYKDYPVSTQFPQLSLANIGDTFNVRDLLFPMTSAGRGRVAGVELFVEKKFQDKWFGQANLSYSRTRYSGLDGVRRPGVFDYPIIANVLGGYRLNARWEGSIRFNYLQGRPYTPFDLGISTAQRRGVFDTNRVAAERLPDYFRTDLRIDRIFMVRDKPLILFAGIQNITNRKNIAGFSWNRSTNRQEFADQLGVFPILGLDWRF
jgi:outer membrane receptor protein involved in Fe transport